MKTIVLIIACSVLAVVWTRERISAARLVDEYAALRQRTHNIADLERERERLRSLQPDAAGFDDLRRAAAERARLQAALDAAEATRLAPQAPLTLGEWTTAPTWKNRGQTTPRATIETALWAAAGGDVAAFKQVCLFTDGARIAAETLRGRLPSETRGLYPSADDLIAACTIKNIPLGEAQVVMCQQDGPDSATVGVLMKNLPNLAGSADRTAGPRISVKGSPDDPPPAARQNGRSAMVYLALRRIDNAWRIVVPPLAIEKIAQELGYAEPLPAEHGGKPRRACAASNTSDGSRSMCRA